MPSNFIVDVRLKENDTVHCAKRHNYLSHWVVLAAKRPSKFASVSPVHVAWFVCAALSPDTRASAAATRNICLHMQLVGQVLQLPVVRDVGLAKLHQKTAQALQAATGSQQAEVQAPPAGSSLVHFLTQAGKFFGKDPTKWEAVGQGKVRVAGVSTGVSRAIVMCSQHQSR